MKEYYKLEGTFENSKVTIETENVKDLQLILWKLERSHIDN